MSKRRSVSGRARSPPNAWLAKATRPDRCSLRIPIALGLLSGSWSRRSARREISSRVFLTKTAKSQFVSKNSDLSPAPWRPYRRLPPWVTPESDNMCLDRQTGPHVQVVTVAFIASTFFRCRFRPCVSARKAFFIGVKVASPKALNDRK